MSLVKHMAPWTLGGHHRWETIYEEKNWKLQHHKTEYFMMAEKPYRLLDPHDHLLASADTEEELKNYLDHLLKH